MLSLSKILVPYDFSSFSKRALGDALLLAQLMKAEMHVIHVEVLYGSPLIETSTAPAKAESLRARVESENTDIKDLFKDVVIYYAVGRDVAPGPPILRYVDDHQIDLIVMGTHGRRGLRRVFIGSVAEEVIRHSECPVLTIGRGEKPVLELNKLKRILVPVDFSEHAEEALVTAKELAALSGAQLDLLHIVHIPSYPVMNDAGYFSVFNDYESDLEEEALKHLKVTYNGSRGPAGNPNYVVRHGQAAHEIVTYAQEEESDLIVIGTHGLTGIDRFLLGSVASRTIRRSPCPVFVLKSFGKSIVEVRARQEEPAVIDTH